MGNRLHGLLLGARYCGRLLAVVNAMVNVKIVGLLQTAGEQNRIVEMGSETQTDVAAGEALRFALRTPFSAVRHRQSLVRQFGEMISATGG
ncbi:hypothetical protein ACO2Q1_13415 [Brevundimonas sp. VNH65]|uniref:hypothetical protein n=1 Tax=Brevundimonas sp. VNH65 TaxID=3400917 RepID=UPI003C079E7F